jgi:hypothetical protein
VLAALSKMTGRPVEKLRSEIEAFSKKIAEDDRQAEPAVRPRHL